MKILGFLKIKNAKRKRKLGEPKCQVRNSLKSTFLIKLNYFRKVKIEVEKPKTPSFFQVDTILKSKKALPADQIQLVEQFFAERNDGELKNKVR